VTHAPAFTAWLDDFFASYYRHRPVNATFIGIHAYDERLPDLSEQGAGDALADAETLLARLKALPDERLSPAEATDRELAAGFLEIQRWELADGRFSWRNPSAMAGEAAFGVISLLRRPFAPAEQRLEAARARMEAIPAFLAKRSAALPLAPEAWIERALDECAGLLELLHTGVDQLIHEHGELGWQLWPAADRAAAAVADFASYLRGRRRDDTGGYACGAEALDLLLRRGHFLAQSADEIARYAEDQLAESAAYLEEHARDFGAHTWQDALAQLADIHPTTTGYYARYAELWHPCRAAAVERDLLTWPDYPIRYVARPGWARAAAPHLYFLFYHSPAPFDNLPEVEYLVAPVEPGMPADEQQRLLRANNDSVIKLNHVVHHGAIGHHVQNWFAYHRAPTRIGKIAAVDCACRLGMFSGGTMAEGWACYVSTVMDEIGFLTPLEQLADQHTRLRGLARAIVDIELHQGTMTLEDAAHFYTVRVGMNPEPARNEAVKNSMFPGAAIIYWLGTQAILDLRAAMQRRNGASWSLRRFHDEFLSHGAIPVSLTAAMMTSARSAS